MLRISLPYVWSICEALEPLGKIDTTKGMDWFEALIEFYTPKLTLETLLYSSVFSKNLRISRAPAETLLATLKLITDPKPSNSVQPDANGNEISAYQLLQLRSAYETFRPTLLAELASFPAFFVDQKGSHDTLTLLDEPASIFPGSLFDKVPEAKFDVAEAGKALCYNLPTACAFHVFRVTEAVLRRYFTQVTGGKSPPKVRNIAVYVNAMRQQKCGNEKILSVVKQMSDLHRNPLIHPDAALTLEEAIATMGMAYSAITAMIAELPAVPKTTASVA